MFVDRPLNPQQILPPPGPIRRAPLALGARGQHVFGRQTQNLRDAAQLVVLALSSEQVDESKIFVATLDSVSRMIHDGFAFSLGIVSSISMFAPNGIYARRTKKTINIS